MAAEAGADLPDDWGLGHVLEHGLLTDADRPALSLPAGDGGWHDVTYRAFVTDVVIEARRLVAHDIEAGDRVVVMGDTSYPWAVADFASLMIGAVTVPIYPTSSAEQVRHILVDSGAAVAYAQRDGCHDLLAAAGGDRLRGGIRSFADIEDLGGRAGPAGEATARADRELAGLRAPELVARRAAVHADALATIAYTSGTTGSPKGCMLTHRNMFVGAANVVRGTRTVFGGPVGAADRINRPTAAVGADLDVGRSGASGGSAAAGCSSTVLGLPLSHVFGRGTLLACLLAGTRTGLVAGVPEMLESLPSFGPTFLVVTPYILEKLHRSVAAAGNDGARETAGLGGRLRHVICGGASLDPAVQHRLGALGISVLCGYGMTESASSAAINDPDTNRPGTVGRAIPGVTITIAADGEVVIRGRNVSPGYWPGPTGPMAGSAPPAGRAGLPGPAGPWATGDGEGLRSGDLGTIDADGYLRITGRRKEILITSGGKNVAPAPLEDRVKLHPLISNCVVVGDGRPYVGALVTLDRAALDAWRTEHGLDAAAADDPVDLRADPRLIAEVQRAVDHANQLVSRAESIRRFRVLREEFSVAGGQLTASLKLRREEIVTQSADEIAVLYATGATNRGQPAEPTANAADSTRATASPSGPEPRRPGPPPG